MSQAGILNRGNGGGATDVLSLTGNSGGPVGPDGSGNINVVGTSYITVAGNPGTNTLTINDGITSSTWTPTIFGSSVAGAGVYATQKGFYTVVGNVVFCEFFVQQTSLTGAMGNVTIGGLPFKVSNSNAIDPIVSVFAVNSAPIADSTIFTLCLQLIHNTFTGTLTEQYLNGGIISNIAEPVSGYLQGNDILYGSFFYLM